MLTHYNDQSIVDALPIAACIFTGTSLIIQAVNEQMLAIWSKDASVIGKSLYEAIPELKNQPVFERQMNEVYQTGHTFNDPNGSAVLLKDGQLQQAFFNYTFKPLRDAAGTIYGIMNTAVDTTEQVKAVSQLTFNENKFRGIFEQSPLAIGLLLGEELIVSEVNDNALALWGHSREAVINKPFRQARPELEGQPFFDFLEATYRSGKTYRFFEKEIYLLRKGKLQRFYVSSVYQPILNADGIVVGLLVIMDDVTESVLMKQEADQSAEQLRLAVSATNLGTWYIDAATRVFTPSPRLKEMFGFYREEEMSYEAAVGQIADEFREQVKEGVELSITQGIDFNMEYSVTGLHDKQLRWLKATGKLYRSAGTFAGTILEITEQKQDEQRKNDFISMVSHELKTPLTSMGGYVQILHAKAQKAEDALATNMLNKANQQVKRMTTIINGFLNTARLESGKIHIDLQRFDIAGLIKDVEEEATAIITNHKLIFEPVEETFVIADRDKLGQVINNFISNATKYSPVGTTIQVACVTKGSKAYVSVQDEGMGVAPQDKDKLFNRFYRAQGATMGSIAGFGIGLYLCAEIIQRHGGEIGVDSELGKGSTFWFTLPVYGEGAGL